MSMILTLAYCLCEMKPSSFAHLVNYRLNKKIKWCLSKRVNILEYRWIGCYQQMQRLWLLRFTVPLKTSFATSFATFFTMLLAAIYNTPAVPNQNSVSIGFILYQICLVLIILKSYTNMKGTPSFIRLEYQSTAAAS